MATYQSLYDIISKATGGSQQYIKGTDIPLSAATVGFGQGGQTEFWYNGQQVEPESRATPYTDYAPNASYGPTQVDPNFTREMKERIINENFGTIAQMMEQTPGGRSGTTEGAGDIPWGVQWKEPRDVWEVLNSPNAQYLDGYFRNVAGYRANENEPNFMDKYVQPLAAGGLAVLGGMAGGDVLSTLLSSGGSAAAGGTGVGGGGVSAAGGGASGAENFLFPGEADVAATGALPSGSGGWTVGSNPIDWNNLRSEEVFGQLPLNSFSGQAASLPGLLQTLGVANSANSIFGGKGSSSNGQGFQLSDLLRGIPGALGALGASQQADAIGELGNKYFGIGAPSRQRYEASFQPGFTMSSDPGYQDALDQATRAFTNRNSVGTGTGGVGTAGPNAWSQTLEDLNSKFAFPALQNYRTQNANTGGFSSFNTAAPGMDTGAIAQQGQVFSNIGGAVGDIFNPPRKRTLADLLGVQL